MHICHTLLLFLTMTGFAIHTGKNASHNMFASTNFSTSVLIALFLSPTWLRFFYRAFRWR